MGQAAKAEIDVAQIGQSAEAELPGPFELARLACYLSKIGEINPPVEADLFREFLAQGREAGNPVEPSTSIEFERVQTLSAVLDVIDEDGQLSGVAEAHGIDSPQFRFLSVIMDQEIEVEDTENGGRKIQGISRDKLASVVSPVSKVVSFDQKTGTVGHVEKLS